MKRFSLAVIFLSAVFCASAQQPSDSTLKVLSLDDAVRIALSENVSVKVADLEIQRTTYAKRGTYASLFPTVDVSAAYQRTIQKQKMYMDVAGMEDGLEVGRWNTWSPGVSASMPIINAQLWKSIKISGEDVELAVEKARSGRIETVTQVKQAYFAVLLAKESNKVYTSVYENALENYKLTEKKFNAKRASELDLQRAKTTLAGAIPNLYESENSIVLALWQLKAVMGVDLDENIDVCGSLEDYASQMQSDCAALEQAGLENNSTMRQLAIQAEQLADAVRVQQAACLPSLAVAFSFSFNAMENDFNFSNYKWSPYSYVGLSLSIPIFAGGKRANSIRQAKVQATELSLQRSNTERQLRIQIRQYLNTMETALRSFDSASQALESAEKAYSIARSSYDVGRSTLTDLNDAQLALVQSRLSLVQTVYSFVVAKSNLEGVIGSDNTIQ